MTRLALFVWAATATVAAVALRARLTARTAEGDHCVDLAAAYGLVALRLTGYPVNLSTETLDAFAGLVADFEDQGQTCTGCGGQDRLSLVMAPDAGTLRHLCDRCLRSEDRRAS